MKNRIEKLIELTLNSCLPYIVNKGDYIQFIDPLDKEEISAHYGNTHLAVSLIIFGSLKNNKSLIKTGEELLFSYIERWNKNKELSDFHNDFNNFALCVLDDYTKQYHSTIKKTILSTDDTYFDTINWLPMRWYVNKCRYLWTNDVSYLNNCKHCKYLIEKASYSDGYIDDMLPKGRSFSLQYNVATVAFMQFLRVYGDNINLDLQLGALLNSVFPDGDINYLGRGTNQIFAWGPWIYLLSSARIKELDRALLYLENHLPTALANNNILLNEFPGNEKNLWWDYHYCSVYTAHILFWLIMALKDYDKKPIYPKLVVDGSSGLQIYKNDSFFIATFNGRTEYLSERGPAIEGIWTRNSGTINKGTLGPWYGLFGNKYVQADSTLRNFTGLMNTNSHFNEYGSKFKRLLPQTNLSTKETISPLFKSPKIEISKRISITYQLNRCTKLINIPCLNGVPKARIDGMELSLTNTLKIKNHYGWCDIYQSRITSGKSITIDIT